MGDLIVSGSNYIQDSVGFSRNLDEQIRVVEGDAHYAGIAGVIAYNIDQIDTTIGAISDFAGKYASTHTTYSQYFNPQNGLLRNFVKRNLIIDPTRQKLDEMGRESAYFVTRTGVELLLKNGTRMLANYSNEAQKYKTYLEIYKFLDLFVQANKENGTDYTSAQIELSKIRSCFDLSTGMKSKLKKQADLERDMSLDSLNLQLLSELNNEQRSGVAYMLSSLACRLYQDDQQINKVLAEYYHLLDYTGNLATEKMRVDRNDYNAVILQQHNMHIVAAQMVRNVIVKAPSIDMDAIQQRSLEMAKYDPYTKRREMAQSTAKEAGKAAAKITIAALCQKDPALATLAATEALSQLNLSNDNVAEDCVLAIDKWFDNSSCSSKILENSRKLAEDAREYRNADN